MLAGEEVVPQGIILTLAVQTLMRSLRFSGGGMPTAEPEVSLLFFSPDQEP